MIALRALVSVIRLELRRSGWILVASVLCAIAAPFIALVPVFGFLEFTDSWRVVALAFSGPLALIAAAAALATTWTNGLFSGRLSFLFSRPIGTGILWFGRLLASTIATSIALTLGALPVLLWAAGELRRSARIEAVEIALVVVMPFVALLTIAVALNPMVLLGRRLSKWTVVFVANLALIAAAFWTVYRWTQVSNSAGPVRLGIPALCLGVLLALLVASWRQWRGGRTDPRLTQRRFSETLSATAAFAVGLPMGIIWWSLHPSPSALDERWGFSSEVYPAGWVMLAGPLKYRPEDSGVFLVHSSTGAWHRLHSGFIHHHSDFRNFSSVSADGSAAVASSLDWSSPGIPQVHYFDLHTGRRHEVELRGSANRFLWPVAVLPHGKALLAGRESLEVFDARSGELLCSTGGPLPASLGRSRPFVDQAPSGIVSILSDSIVEPGECGEGFEEQVVLVNIAVDSCSVDRRVLCAAPRMEARALALNAAKQKAVSVSYRSDGHAPRWLHLHDLSDSTSRELLILGDEPSFHGASDVRAVFTADDAVLVTWVEADRAQLAVISASGDLVLHHELPVGSVRFLSQLASGRVLVAVAAESGSGSSLSELDLYSGELHPVPSRLRIRRPWEPTWSRLPAVATAEDPDTGEPFVVASDGTAHQIRRSRMP